MVAEDDFWPQPEDMEILGKKYPDLKNWIRNRWTSSAGHACGRPASLDFGANLQVSVNHFQEAAALARYFTTPTLQATPPEPRRRLFLLEGADNGLRRVFARELDIDPQVWARHDWVPTVDSRWDPTQSIGIKLSLPSLADSSETFFVDYLQMMYLNLETQDFSLRCAENGRRISSSRVDGNFDNVGIIGRRVSF